MRLLSEKCKPFERGEPGNLELKPEAPGTYIFINSGTMRVRENRTGRAGSRRRSGSRNESSAPEQICWRQPVRRPFDERRILLFTLGSVRRSSPSANLPYKRVLPCTSTPSRIAQSRRKIPDCRSHPTTVNLACEFGYDPTMPPCLPRLQASMSCSTTPARTKERQRSDGQ